MRKGSPHQQIRHVAVSFDDWDNPRTQDTNFLTPTVAGSSSPTNTSALETVQEQSAPSSPQPLIIVTETSFPYTPEETTARVARSLETEFNEERKAIAPRDEKKPLIKISSDETMLNDPLGDIPISNKLVEVPIDFENSKQVNADFSASKSDQNKFENELSEKLNLLEFESDITPEQNLLDGSGNSTISDVATIGSLRPDVSGWSGTLNDGNSLSNSIDSGLHESTDQLLDARDLGSRDTMDSDGSSGQNFTQRGTEGELKIGQVITVGDSKVGLIRYIGTTEFASGDWVGVELELPVG